MAHPPRHTVPACRYRLGIASRVLAATVGGYAMSALVASALAAVLPLLTPASRADGVLIASLLGFVFHAGAVVWVFSTRSATRAWLGLAGVSAACAALAALLLRT